MKYFEVTDNSLLAHNFRWAFNQTFNPLASKPSRTQMAKKVLSAIGNSGISSVEINEDFVVELYSNKRLVTSLSFTRIQDELGDSDSMIEVMCVQSKDFDVVWKFTKTQIVASTLKGASEAVNGFLGKLGSAFHIDDIKAKLNSAKKDWNDKKDAWKEFQKDPFGVEKNLKDITDSDT